MVQQCYLLLKRSKKAILNFSSDSLIVTEQYFNGTSKKENCLNEANDSKFMTRKWNNFNDQSNVNYDVGNEIIYNTEVLRSNLCDYKNAYILVKGNFTVAAAPATQVSF